MDVFTENQEENPILLKYNEKFRNDPVSTSEVPIMQEEEEDLNTFNNNKGKKNLCYQYSIGNGTMVSLHNNNIATKKTSPKSKTNGKIPLSNANSTASSRYEDGSIIDLVATVKKDNNICCGTPQVNCCQKHKYKFIIFFMVMLIVLVVAMTTLYILEKKMVDDVAKPSKEKGSSQDVDVKNQKPVISEAPGCFHRAVPIKLHNVKKQPEIRKAIEQFQNAFQTSFIRNSIHAMSLSVHYRGEDVWLHNYGEFNRFASENILPTEDTPYPIASVSKVFTVLMLEKFLERSLIKNIDDEIWLYNKDFYIKNPFNNANITFSFDKKTIVMEYVFSKAAQAALQKMYTFSRFFKYSKSTSSPAPISKLALRTMLRLRELACMMSGLPRESPCSPITSLNMCPQSSATIFKRVQNMSLISAPGYQPFYSNLALGILGRTLEGLLHNQTYEEWVTENIIQPLNMTNTGFDIQNRKSDIPRSTTKGGKHAKLFEWGWLNPTGGLYSSIRDLGKLGSAFLGYSKHFKLTRSSIQRMFRKAYVWSDLYSQSCPFELLPISLDLHHKEISYMNYEKAGSTLGYTVRFTLIPQLKLNINVAVASPDESAAFFIRQYLTHSFVTAFDELLKRKNKKQYTYKLPPNPEQYIGTYNLTSYWPLITSPCCIEYKNGRLTMTLEWFQVDMTYIKQNTLRPFRSDQNCIVISTGLLGDKYFFTAPTDQNGSSSFYVNSIASYGYARFEKIKTSPICGRQL